MAMHFSLVQLEYIVAVDTWRHFATAAEKCFVTQPTLSMQIQKMEEALGIKIFDRSKQPVIPTEAGELLIEKARTILHLAQDLEEQAKVARGEISGRLRLGVIPTLAPYLIPLFVRSFIERYPLVKMSIVEMTTTNMIRQLKNDMLDAALLVTPLQENGLQENPLFYEEFMAYVSSEETAYSKEFILAEDIDVNKLWLLEEGHCFRAQMMNLCELRRQGEQDKHFDYEAGSIETLKKMVEQHHGITLLPKLATLDLSDKQKLMLRPFKHPAPVREVSLVSHRNFAKKKLLEALKAEIVSHIPVEWTKKKGGNVVGIINA